MLSDVISSYLISLSDQEQYIVADFNDKTETTKQEINISDILYRYSLSVYLWRWGRVLISYTTYYWFEYKKFLQFFSTNSTESTELIKEKVENHATGLYSWATNDNMIIMQQTSLQGF